MKKLILVLLAFVSTGAEAKLSSTKIKKQAENIEAVISTCVFDKSVLNEVKSKSIGTSVTSGVATVASGVGATTSTMAALKAGKIIKANENNKNIAIGEEADAKSETNINKDNNAKLKNLRLASTIASGVATGANLVSVALSASSTKELAELMDKAEDCNNALSNVSISE